MTLTSFLIAMSAALILAIVGVIYVRSIHKNTSSNREKRKELIHRAGPLRLPRMMQALGIGLGRYFYKGSLHDIEKNLDDCESCESTKLCDEKLKIPELNPGDIEFCPGRERLAPFSRERRIKN
jgi:hypothetical protein